MSSEIHPRTVPYEFLGPPGDLNPTLLMLLASIVLIVGATFGYFWWELPGSVTFVLNVLALHLAGTVIHDASHNVAHRNGVMNAVMGHASALILGFAFPVFTRVHMQHHANVNDPKNDPDHFVSTCGPLWLIAPRFFYHEIFFFQRRLWRKFELLEWFLSRLTTAGIIWFASSHGHLGYIMNYWFTPALVVGVALGLFFDYLPHRDFQERNRWKNARVYPGKLLNILILGQNYHLIHHLWPSIPWYKVQPAYYAVKPLLDAKESPQTLNIFNRQNIGSFLYDVLIGIRFHHSEPSEVQSPQESENLLLLEDKHQLSELLREQTAEARETACLQTTDRAA